MDYDVIIVGSGVAGLMCGSLLSNRGYKVLVLEKNNFVGGCCSSFTRKGFSFDACVHWFSGCGPGSFIDKLFKKMGIEINFKKYVPMDRFHFTDEDIIVSEGVDDYRDLLISRYPEEEKSILDFFDEMSRTNELLFSLIMDPTGKRDPSETEILSKTYKEILDKYFKSDSLKTILAAEWGFIGSPPNEASATVMMSMMYNYYKDGAYYPEGGAQKFADKMAEYIREHGGEVRTKAEVIALNIEDDCVKSVKLKDGEEYRAKIYISNADAKHNTNVLIDNEKIKKPEWMYYRNKINDMEESMSMFIMYLGLNIPSETLCEKVGWYYNYGLNAVDKCPGINPDYFSEGYLVNVPSALDPSICPQNKSVMILYTSIAEDFNDKQDDWLKIKKHYERKCLDFIDSRLFRDIEKYIEVKISASPKTIYRYTYNSKGAAYGWAMIPNQMWEKRLPIESPIDNLFFTGHWTVPGGSVILAAISGWMAGFKVINYLNS